MPLKGVCTALLTSPCMCEKVTWGNAHYFASCHRESPKSWPKPQSASSAKLWAFERNQSNDLTRRLRDRPPIRR